MNLHPLCTPDQHRPVKNTLTGDSKTLDDRKFTAIGSSLRKTSQHQALLCPLSNEVTSFWLQCCFGPSGPSCTIGYLSSIDKGIQAERVWPMPLRRLKTAKIRESWKNQVTKPLSWKKNWKQMLAVCSWFHHIALSLPSKSGRSGQELGFNHL